MCSMPRSVAGHYPHNLFILAIYNSKNFTTRWFLAIEHMAMFVVKSAVIQINGQVYGSIILVSQHLVVKFLL